MRLSLVTLLLAAGAAPYMVLGQGGAAGPADPAAAGAAGASGGGATPVAPPVAPLSKKALIGSALRELTSVLAAPAGASAPAGKMNGALSNILSIALDNRNFLGAEGVFDFGPSGAASVMWPTGNVRSIQRFAASLLNASTTGDVANIVGTLNAGLDGVCSPERFTPSRLTPASCRSGEVELRLVPGECLLAPTTGELVCRPAYLLLEQRPAECSLPHMTPAQWEGRSCAAFSLIGPKVDYAVGYQQFSTALPSPTPIANALLTPLRGAGQRLLEKVGALAAKKVLRGVPVGGGVGGGGAATSTTAAVDGARQG